MAYTFIKSQLITILLLTVFAFPTGWTDSALAESNVLIIDKHKKSLVLLKDGSRLSEFPVALGIDPDSDKYKAGDGATPEGLYSITSKREKSRFHRFLGISYPNLENAAKALARGVISSKEYKKIANAAQKSAQPPSGTRLGGAIGIHGGGVFRSFGGALETDWTEGCIALDNRDIEKVFDFCQPGDPVILFNSRRNLYGLIRPFTHPVDIGSDGIPTCPDGICTYQVEILAPVGRFIITVKEGKAYGKSLQVTAYTGCSDRENPFLSLLDRNADGHLCPMDSVNGTIADEKTPDGTYHLIQETVITILSSGRISSKTYKP